LGTFFRRQTLRSLRPHAPFSIPPLVMRPSPVTRSRPSPPWLKVALPTLFAFGSTVSPRAGLGNRHGGHQEKRNGETADHSFARIHHPIIPCPVPCPGVNDWSRKDPATTRWAHSAPKLLPMVFDPC
jgi:hypothetical protein